jgi:hypothetical protein
MPLSLDRAQECNRNKLVDDLTQTSQDKSKIIRISHMKIKIGNWLIEFEIKKKSVITVTIMIVKNGG